MFTILQDSLLWCRHKLSGMAGTATARGGTSRSRTSSIVPGRLAERVSCPSFPFLLLNMYFPLSEFQSSLLLKFTSATGRIGIHTAPKYSTKPIQYVTLHFQDWRGTSSPSYRNRAATIVLVCEQKPKPV